MNRPRPSGAAATLLAALAIGGGPAAAQTLTLRAAADSALASHPTVLASEARVSSASSDADAARSAYLPSVTGSAGLTRFEEPMVVAPLHGFDLAAPPAFDRTLIQSQVGLEYTLFDGGARSARSRGASARADGARSGDRWARMRLLESVTAAYVGVLAAREVHDAALRQVEALDAEATRARQRLAEGTAARVEVLRAEAALLDAQAQRATAEARTNLAERALARLMGTDPAQVIARPLADVAPRPAAAPGNAAGDDPRVVAARRAVDAARARLDQERAGRFPTLRASTGLQSFGSAGGDHVTEWQAGVRLSWPLFTGGARSAAIARAEADLRAAEEELRLAELTRDGELDSAEADLVAAAGAAEALEASVAQWQEVTRIEALSLETGAGVQQDWLRAQAALFQARAGWARARYDEILALAAKARVQGLLDPEWIDGALESVR